VIARPLTTAHVLSETGGAAGLDWHAADRPASTSVRATNRRAPAAGIET
jgi:hypothetical protein